MMLFLLLDRSAALMRPSVGSAAAVDASPSAGTLPCMIHQSRRPPFPIDAYRYGALCGAAAIECFARQYLPLELIVGYH
jgi:hypothetical protein